MESADYILSSTNSTENSAESQIDVYSYEGSSTESSLEDLTQLMNYSGNFSLLNRILDSEKNTSWEMENVVYSTPIAQEKNNIEVSNINGKTFANLSTVTDVGVRTVPSNEESCMETASRIVEEEAICKETCIPEAPCEPNSEILEENGQLCSTQEIPEKEITSEEINMESSSTEPTQLPYNISSYLHSSVPISKRKERIWDKRDLCMFCFQNVTNFSRHLLRKHINEPTVKMLNDMKLGSIERKKFIDMLRKKGNFLSPGLNQINTVRRPTKEVSAENILPCIHCNGFFMKRYLNRHFKICSSRPETATEKQKLSDAQTFLAFRCMETEFVSKLKMKDGVLDMRCDHISFTVKSEPLILSFGSFYAKRHRHQHLNKVTRNKLRELARLWLELSKYIEEQNFFDALKPKNFKFFVMSTRTICGYNAVTQKFDNAPSLALHMGTTLKQLCDHAYSETKQMNNALIRNNDPVKTAKDVKTLKELICSNWNAEISSVANQNLMENQWQKPTIIPLTSDIKKLNNFAKQKAEISFQLLKADGNDKQAFNNLQKSCYSLLITLNRRRIGELERIELQSYTQEANSIISEEFQRNLTDTERILLTRYKRILIRGKRHKPVPVLFSTIVQTYIDLLLKHRQNFIPAENIYLFATPGKCTCLDGYTSLRTIVKECGAEYPHALTSGKLRKHIATISQVSDLSQSEMEQLCTFLGHTLSTHNNFYRLPQEIYQTAKLTKLLLRSQDEDIENTGNENDDTENLNEELHSEDEENEEINEDVDFQESTSIDHGVASENQVTQQQTSSEQKTNKNKSQTKKSSRYEIDEDYELEDDEMDDAHREQRKKNRKIKKQSAYEADETEITKVKHPKIRWTEQQKNTTIRYFQGNIKRKKPPTELEIEKFKSTHTFMSNKTWKQIKAFVFNAYRKLC